MADPVLVTNPARPRDHGSGFVIRRLDGAGAQVVTCSHVVRALGADGLQVAGQPARLIIDLAGDGIDLAVLAVPGLTEPAPMELQRGTPNEDIELLGFEPAGGGPLAVPHRGRLARASITAIGGHNRSAWHLELADGDIEGGHSGGPVISVRSGRVVGVIAMGPEQQGGKDGVAVGIENLRVWKDAPPVLAARAATVDPPVTDGSGDSLIPSIIRPAHRWIWVAIVGGAVALAGAALAMHGWSSTTKPPPPPVVGDCGRPDLRDGLGRTAVVDWCPDSHVEVSACVRTFADGARVQGSCAGTVATGDWTYAGPDGQWDAHFDTGGGRELGVWLERRKRTSGATYELTIRHDVEVPGRPGTGTSRTEEWRCSKPGDGDSTWTSVEADVESHAREVTLSVTGGSFVCTIARVGPADVVSECRRGLRKVTGAAASDAYLSVLDSRRAIENCQPTELPELPKCGDAIVNTGEECDDGEASARCTEQCKLSRCGDGLLNRNAGEQCDPGPLRETRSCDRDCTPRECNDGVKNAAAGEVCDPPKRPGSKTCESNCLAPRCGDGIVNAAAGEQCDAGGAATATCLATCKTSRCGDKQVNPLAGEECDDGKKTLRCTLACKRTVGLPGRPTPLTPTAPVTPIGPATTTAPTTLRP
jgi:hypothetical protein